MTTLAIIIWVSGITYFGFSIYVILSVKPLSNERILCSAIWYKQLPLVRTFKANVLPVNIDTGIVFCGFRHTHCMYTMISVTGKRSVETEVGEYEQGFLTSKNRFVDRKEAWVIAEREGQIKKQSGGYGTLYSECLW